MTTNKQTIGNNSSSIIHNIVYSLTYIYLKCVCDRHMEVHACMRHDRSRAMRTMAWLDGVDGRTNSVYGRFCICSI